MVYFRFKNASIQKLLYEIRTTPNRQAKKVDLLLFFEYSKVTGKV